jgi:uncharacterized protein YggU (UPF0235/DUF167 family)
MGTTATIPIRVKPGASRTRVGGRHEGPHGPALVVAVSAPAVDGRATAAALRAVAEALGLRPADLRLRLGANSRDKLIVVDEPPRDLDRRVRELRDAGRAD